MKKIITLVILFFFISISFAYAYETDTHEYFTEKALNAAGLKRGEYLQYKEEIIGGSRYEDEESHGLKVGQYRTDILASGKQLYKPCSVIGHPYCNHFLNPYTNKGLSGYQSAYERAEILWQFAKWSYAQGNKENAYFNLGRVAHLAQDMAVPEHTRLVKHPSKVIYPYEDYADGVKYSYQIGHIKNFNNLKDLFYDLAEISYKQGVVKSNTYDKNTKLKQNADMLMPKAIAYTANLLKIWDSEKDNFVIGRGNDNLANAEFDIENNKNVVATYSNKRYQKCSGSNWLKTYDYEGHELDETWCSQGCNSRTNKCYASNSVTGAATTTSKTVASSSTYKQCSGKYLKTYYSSGAYKSKIYCWLGCDSVNKKCKSHRKWW